MSRSSYAVGFYPPNGKWREMNAVWEACKAANVGPPKEVEKFFDGTEPDPAGLEVDIDDCLTDWTDDCSDGVDVDVSKLPPGLSIVRFVNSY